MQLQKINTGVIQCKKCPELISYCENVAKNKVKRHQTETYWGKPVPGFGDPKAKLLIIGLAPAAHGANRTGRMFTGDSSGDWLFKALHQTGFANQPTSNSLNDGLQLNNCFVTSTIHCAPPQNKPTNQQISNCTHHLLQYLHFFNKHKVVITLGGISFKNYCRSFELKKLAFGHHKIYALQNGKTLISSYHPSKYNTQTRRLLWKDWLKVFESAALLIL